VIFALGSKLLYFLERGRRNRAASGNSQTLSETCTRLSWLARREPFVGGKLGALPRHDEKRVDIAVAAHGMRHAAESLDVVRRAHGRQRQRVIRGIAHVVPETPCERAVVGSQHVKDYPRNLG